MLSEGGQGARDPIPAAGATRFHFELRNEDQAMASRCAALVSMASKEEALVAREKLDGVIPEGTGASQGAHRSYIARSARL